MGRGQLEYRRRGRGGYSHTAASSSSSTPAPAPRGRGKARRPREDTTAPRGEGSVSLLPPSDSDEDAYISDSETLEGILGSALDAEAAYASACVSSPRFRVADVVSAGLRSSFPAPFCDLASALVGEEWALPGFDEALAGLQLHQRLLLPESMFKCPELPDAGLVSSLWGDAAFSTEDEGDAILPAIDSPAVNLSAVGDVTSDAASATAAPVAAPTLPPAILPTPPPATASTGLTEEEDAELGALLGL